MSKTELVFTHQATCIRDIQDTQTLELQGVLELPGDDTKYFGRRVKSTKLPPCSDCPWRDASLTEKPYTCTGMESGTSIAAYVDAQSGSGNGNMEHGLQILEAAIMTVGNIERDKALFLRKLIPKKDSFIRTSTVFKYPNFPCAQPVDVTVQLEEKLPD